MWHPQFWWPTTLLSHFSMNEGYQVSILLSFDVDAAILISMLGLPIHHKVATHNFSQCYGIWEHDWQILSVLD